MSEKQTRCPTCSTIYKVSVTQLTVAQGMVCCPKCLTDFNALLHLVEQKQVPPSTNAATESNTIHQYALDNALAATKEHDVLDIFERKIESSNINLRTYLNNLNYFNHDPVCPFPTLNLSSGISTEASKITNHKTFIYYAMGSTINLLLILILMFQILWFNPKLLDQSPLLNSFFIYSCNLFNCETLDQRYRHIQISQLTLQADTGNSTVFSGRLVNQYEKGLALPLIKVSLLKHGRVQSSYIQAPSDYLIESLMGITRIPTNQPYRFKFKIKQSINSFDSYNLELIRP